jgi:crotonobetainyl-CoA:carnitine CoA-transferase CaiB-like acyl-CoA transferase
VADDPLGSLHAGHGAGPLAGIRVVDVSTTFLGPLATYHMAQMGADVIKVEPPGGDVIRNLTAGTSPGMSPTFLRLNRGKRSLVLDLKRPGHRHALGRLIARSDVFLHNMRPDAAARLRLDHASIMDDNPKIVYCAAYGYGQAGPYARRPAYDDIIQAASGMAAIQGVVTGVPTYVVSTVSDKTCAMMALTGTLAALVARERTGRAQSVEIPMFETMVADVLMEHMMGMIYEPPHGPPGSPRTMSKYRRPYRTTDGYLGVLLYTDAHWRAFLSGIGRKDLLVDPLYQSMTTRNASIDEVYGFLEETIAGRSTDEWMTFLDQLDVPAFPVMSLEALFEDPHLKKVGFFELENHPTEGTLRQMRPTMLFGGSSNAPPMRPAPHLGEHTRDVLNEVGLGADEIDQLISGAAPA